MKKAKLNKEQRQRSFNGRCYFVAFLLVAGAVGLFSRAVYLQVVNEAFLEKQADARHIRVAQLPAYRGTITDRNGEVLAVSTPVDSIWANPQILLESPGQIAPLAKLLGQKTKDLNAKLSRNSSKEFVYLKRHMNPTDAEEVIAKNVPGVYVQREYRRYYPAGEVTGHLLGFTNIDDQGQEGLELAFDHRLAGSPGKKKVLKDKFGRFVEDIEAIKAPHNGQEIITSLDLRIQYLAYRSLKGAVQKHKAKAGTAVVVDVHSGEVLAMVNQPTYNPNNRASFQASHFRNRAITDIFEPGSSFKPLVIAAALETGEYKANSRIDTSPGWIKVGPKQIKDKKNHGRMSMATLLHKSSNVGATKIAMDLESEDLWNVLSRFGVGQSTASGIHGESAGLFSHYSNWRPIAKATLGYGYGVSVTALQLAQAYAVFGNGGLQRPVSLVRVEQAPIARRVVQPEVADAVLGMMEGVTQTGGTGTRAAITGYRVAGKTGTSLKAAAGGYAEKTYTAVFAGLVPVSNPRLAVVVIVDEPSAGEYYGGSVSAPVFADIASGAMRILAVPPDDTHSVRGPNLTLAEVAP